MIVVGIVVGSSVGIAVDLAVGSAVGVYMIERCPSLLNGVDAD